MPLTMVTMAGIALEVSRRKMPEGRTTAAVL